MLTQVVLFIFESYTKTSTVNYSLNRGSEISRRRKWRTVHPVVVADACFERSLNVTYKTVCVVLRDNDFTLIKENYTLLYTRGTHLVFIATRILFSPGIRLYIDFV